MKKTCAKRPSIPGGEDSGKEESTAEKEITAAGDALDEEGLGVGNRHTGEYPPHGNSGRHSSNHEHEMIAHSRPADESIAASESSQSPVVFLDERIVDNKNASNEPRLAPPTIPPDPMPDEEQANIRSLSNTADTEQGLPTSSPSNASAPTVETDEENYKVFSAYVAPTREETRRRWLERNAVTATNVHVVQNTGQRDNRGKGIKAAVVLAVIIAAAIGISLGIALSRKDNASDKTQPTLPLTLPPTSARFDQVAELVETLFNTTFEDPSSPRYKAVQWMADVDTIFEDLGTVDLDHFTQRYALVVFYFATGGPTSWTDTSFFLKPNVHECDWWNYSTPFWNPSLNYTPAAKLRIGIIGCLSEQWVQGLDINQNNLTGTLPHELGSLHALAGLSFVGNHIGGALPRSLFNLDLLYLSLWPNEFTGTIPTEIGAVTKLLLLNLGYNFFTGTIPTELGKLSVLEHLSLLQNFLTGTIPETLLRLSKLKVVDFGRNELSGTLPQSLFSSWSNLTMFGAHENELSGTIPNNLDTLSHLKTFAVSINNFTGPFPSTIAALTNVEHISVASNYYLTGTLPNDWSNLSSTLKKFFAGNSSITGTLPENIGDLSNLELLYLSLTHLNGTVPESLGNLTNLSGLYLNANQFKGTVPKSFVRLSSLQELTLQGNKLTGDLSFLCNGKKKLFPALRNFGSDCFGEIDCPCCNFCCTNYSCEDVQGTN